MALTWTSTAPTLPKGSSWSERSFLGQASRNNYIITGRRSVARLRGRKIAIEFTIYSCNGTYNVYEPGSKLVLAVYINGTLQGTTNYGWKGWIADGATKYEYCIVDNVKAGDKVEIRIWNIEATSACVGTDRYELAPKLLTNLYVKVDGAWKDAVPWVKINGAWKQMDTGKVNVGGVWK